MKLQASAEWQGSLKDGNGTLTTESKVLVQTQYSFGTRFENGIGTNPEELIATAHAGCFAMALSAQLGSAELVPEKIATTAVVSLDNLDAGWMLPQAILRSSPQFQGSQLRCLPDSHRRQRPTVLFLGS
jgi:lipoyl-dependent peroxiredoxin